MFTARTRWASSPNRLAAALERLRRERRPILDLTVSNPTQCGFQFDENAILSALAQPAAMVYEAHPRGLPSARQAVADYYAEQDVTVSPENIVLTAGTSEAYSFLFRLLAGPGDEILAPSPSYPLFDFLADLNDLKVVSYPLQYDHGWRTGIDELAASITPRSRAVIVVTPNNPTGSFLYRQELDRLIELAQQHDLAVIADEVFRDYAWRSDVDRARSAATVDACLSFTLNGLSKISALPQMKLAWIAANGPADRLAEALARLEVIADTYLSVSTPVQHAAAALLAHRKRLQPQILERIRQNLEGLDQALVGSPCTRLRAEGGWYAVIRLPGTRSDEAWALELLENDGVYIHPGHFFDFPADHHLIISLITPEETFHAGVRSLLQSVRRPG